MKSINKHKQKLISRSYLQSITAVVVIIAVAIIGVVLLVSSHAASPYVSSTASTRVLAGSAMVQANPAGGNYVQFGSPFYDGKLLGVQGGSTDPAIPDLVQLHANSTRPEISLDSAGTAFGDIVGHETVTTEKFLDDTTSAHIESVPLLDTYDNITPTPNIYTEPTVWASAVVTWCKTFCYGGTFWLNNQSANEYYAPHVLEMLNEPYGGWYRNGAVPPADYAAMLIDTRAALNAAGLSDIFILGAAGESSQNCWTMAVAAANLANDNCGTTVSAASDGYAAVQGLAVHPYSDTNITLPAQATLQNGWDILYYLHQTYNMNIYVTEVGWCSNSTVDNAPCGGNSLNDPEAEKDANITDAINQLATVPWLEDFNYFNLVDYGTCVAQASGPCIDENLSLGLILANGTKTPAYGVYEQAAIANGL